MDIKKVCALMFILGFAVMLPWNYLDAKSYEEYSWFYVVFLIVFVAVPLSFKSQDQ